ncbi:MAG TPA: elongation factor P lysine(34) lysyltransferase [Oceanospirillaceae bacterium]|nr:elongation factor P lysine(34) lysyltransferase [Oceanospirillaceae bacterium]
MASPLWQPSAELPMLLARARLLAQLRAFFAQRDVLEVDTPVLSHHGVSDPHIDSIAAKFVPDGAPAGDVMHLMSSPEYAMKRLLVQGSGCIYQVAKAFRNGEAGRRHNPEFTMLEWYRVGYDLEQLMAEVAQLLDLLLLPALPHLDWQFLSYEQAFVQTLGVNPMLMHDAELQTLAQQHVDMSMPAVTPRDTWLDLLMSHCVEPALPPACFVYNYPASQAALARVVVDGNGHLVARRFEVYVQGMELANGYHELADADEQAKRFAEDNQTRVAMDKVEMPADLRLVAALQHGLPDCSGVAMGLERILMLAHGKQHIAEVLAFDFSRA